MSRKKNTKSNKRRKPGTVTGKCLADGCNRLIRENPKNFRGFFIRAQLKYNQGDIQGAVLDLDEFLSKFPANVKALVFRGVILYYLCEYRGAMRDLSDAVLIDPGYWDVYLIRGEVYRALGKLTESVDDFDRVINASPGIAMAYISRAETKLLQHDTVGAKSDYARAIALNPEYISLCPTMETINAQERVLVNAQESVSENGPVTVSDNDPGSGLLKNDAHIPKSILAVLKITLRWKLRQLSHFYDRFKVMFQSSINCVILILVLPVNELLTAFDFEILMIQ